jgi:hypothetical protein
MSQFTFQNTNIENYFQSPSLQFEENVISNKEYITNSPYDNREFTFGILNLPALASNITTVEQEFVFNIDCSGSMSDMCSDGRSKMQHITHTLINMIHYFHDHSIPLNITIFAFDNSVHTIIERTTITDDNIDSILNKINKIRPLSSTNIEIALQKSFQYIQQLKIDYPTHDCNHIFMTDGEVTDGSNDSNILRNNIDKKIHNSFIGFGVSHDFALLNRLSVDNKSSYHFIDKLENAGLVYGEILHSILYKFLTDFEITINNGFIYNYKSNLWTDTLFVGDYVGESCKSFHIISDDIDSCYLKLSFTNNNHPLSFHLVGDENSVDLSKYIFRQRTLQLLFEVNELEQNISKCKNRFWNDEEKNKFTHQIPVMRTKLKVFLVELKKYMTDNHLSEDKILKNLCDDIYISFNLIGTQHGGMYTCARQTSQGNQQGYMISQPLDNEDFNSPPPILRRNNRVFNRSLFLQDVEEEEKEEVEEDVFHEISTFVDSPYLSQGATQMMRCISERNVSIDGVEEETQVI